MIKKIAYPVLITLVLVVFFIFAQKTNTVTDRLDTDFSCAYAFLSAEDTTQLTTPLTYYKIKGAFNNEVLVNFAIVSDTLTYIGDIPIYFEVILNASFSASVVNTTTSIALYKNNVLQSNSIMTIKLNQTTDTKSLGLVDVLRLENGDNVTIVITADKTCFVTMHNVNTSIKRFCI